MQVRGRGGLAAVVVASLGCGSATAGGLDSPVAVAPVSAPLPSAAPGVDWSGPFVGANLGFSFSDGEADRGAASGAIIVTDIRNGLFPASIDDLETSAAGGIAIGYDYQRGNLVAGVELGLSVLDQNTSLGFSAIDPEIIVGATTATSYQTEIDRMATLRVRAGLAQGRTLYFATAGLAVADVSNTFGLSIDTIGYDSSWTEDGRREGYILGVGFERMVTERISLRAEIAYVDLADVTVEARDPVVFPGNALDYEFRNAGGIAQFGVNYRF